MSKTYVTFGQDHAHSVNGKTFDKDCVAVINCNDAAHGRQLAFEFFGGKFFTAYTKGDIDDLMQFYPRGYIEVNPITRTLSEEGPVVTYAGTLSMQVCVPSTYTDAQVLEFANLSNPCGTVCGWVIRTQGHELLAGADERVKCTERDNYVHIILDA